MGGPISQALFQGINQIDIDILGQDGVTIDNLLAHLNRQAKENIIQTSMNTTATFMSFNDNIIARQQIAEILIERHNIYTDEFHQIMSLYNVRQMNFN
jgi:predicted LPLAT superfamily acyltransferase